MTHPPDVTVLEDVMELVMEHGVESMGEAFRTLLNLAMRLERDQVLGAKPYERSGDRRGYANGYKAKTVATRTGPITLAVPQTRDVPFYPSALEKGVRSERALKLAIAEMYIQGVSTRKVTQVVEELCGLEVTSTQVSRAAAELDEKLIAWRERPLGAMPYVILDARYEKVRHGGTVVSCALLTAIGIQPDGKRVILGTSVSLTEAEVHWREFLESLKRRGLCDVRLIVSDAHSGLGSAREAVFAGVPWQRCQFHLIQDAMAYVPKQGIRSEVAQGLRTVFNAADMEESQRRLDAMVARYQDTAPRLSSWLGEAIPEGLTVLTVPVAHQRRLRTTNCLERIHRELKRRTRVATMFPNEASLLRLVSAVLSEISDEWETARMYLDMSQN
jgi:putative transposase